MDMNNIPTRSKNTRPIPDAEQIQYVLSFFGVPAAVKDRALDVIIPAASE
jgi:hypothetical protein